MRVIFAGTPATAVPTLEAIAASEHELVAVITRPDAPHGRGRQLKPSEVAQWAVEHQIEVFKPNTVNDPVFIKQLEELQPDIFVVVAYGALIKREALLLGTYGWVNLHFSVLPSWRGAAPVQYAIMSGDEVSGATVFALVEELDAGPVLGTITETIRSNDTATSLLERLATRGASLLVDVLDHVDELSPIDQSLDAVSFAPKITTDEAKIRWDHPAQAVERRIRALTEEPGAWTEFGEQRIKIGPVGICESSSLAPGMLQISKNSVLAGTATQDVELSWVIPPGKKSMIAADWARGLRTVDEMRFR